MDYLTFFLDFLKLTFAGLTVFFVAWFFIREHLSNSNRRELLEVKKEQLKQTLPLQLQAYERIVIFIERINPANILIRLHVPGTTARELQNQVLADIRAEYQHNITQQIYLSDQAWQVVKRLKEDTISLIKNGADGLPPETSSVELSKAILTHLSKLEVNPYDAGIGLVKNELQRFF